MTQNTGRVLKRQRWISLPFKVPHLIVLYFVLTIIPCFGFTANDASISTSKSPHIQDNDPIHDLLVAFKKGYDGTGSTSQVAENLSFFMSDSDRTWLQEFQKKNGVVPLSHFRVDGHKIVYDRDGQSNIFEIINLESGTYRINGNEVTFGQGFSLQEIYEKLLPMIRNKSKASFNLKSLIFDEAHAQSDPISIATVSVALSGSVFVITVGAAIYYCYQVTASCPEIPDKIMGQLKAWLNNASTTPSIDSMMGLAILSLDAAKRACHAPKSKECASATEKFGTDWSRLIEGSSKVLTPSTAPCKIGKLPGTSLPLKIDYCTKGDLQKNKSLSPASR